MSIHIQAAASACSSKAAHHANDYYLTIVPSEPYRRIIEACVAAEIAEARATIAELRLKVLQLETENQRLQPVYRDVPQ